MTNPIFWLGLSVLFVALSLTIAVVVAIPAIRELGRAARSAEKLFDTLSRELPPTLEAIRLTGMEISDLTDDMSSGVQSAGQVVQKVDRSLEGARQQAQRVQSTAGRVVTGVRAAWRSLTRSGNRNNLPARRSPDRLPPGRTSYDGSEYDDGSYDDGSYDDGSYDDGSYDDGSYGLRDYDDGGYGEKTDDGAGYGDADRRRLSYAQADDHSPSSYPTPDHPLPAGSMATGPLDPGTSAEDTSGSGTPAPHQGRRSRDRAGHPTDIARNAEGASTAYRATLPPEDPHSPPPSDRL